MLSVTLTKNTTKVPKEQIEWLIKFCVDYTNKALKIQSDITYRIETGLTPYGYKGRHYGSRRLIRVWIDFQKNNGHRHEYSKWKNMPVFVTTDATEDFVYVMTHELAHHKFSGRREGEFHCELLGQDAVVAFRKVREKYDKLVTRLANRKPAKLTKAEKENQKRKKEWNSKIRWIRKYCKDNNIHHNLIRNVWDDEMSFTLNGEGRIFEGMGDYMYCVGAIDAYERLKHNTIINKR